MTLENFSSPSASWKTPPPVIADLLLEIVVFSISALPSALLQKPPPSPPSRRSPPSSSPGIRVVLPTMLELMMWRSASGALAKPPPLSAMFFWIVVSMTVNGSLDEL